MKLRLISCIKIVLLHVKIMCSQVSLRLFDQIEDVCRNIHGNNIGFGGIQVVACGDFFQLPPVPDMGHGDAGDYALTSKFMQAMHHCNISTENELWRFHKRYSRSVDWERECLLYALVDLFLANVCQYMLTILLRRHLDCGYILILVKR